jgi:hypothetical protein
MRMNEITKGVHIGREERRGEEKSRRETRGEEWVTGRITKVRG